MMYLNFNKQLISIRESENQTEFSFLILCFTFPVHYSISLAVISKKLGLFLLQTRKWCMSCMIQSLLYVYFYQGAISIYRSRLISIKCDKIISFCYKNGVYSTFDVDYIIIEAPSLSQTLSWQFVFPLCGELFCSLYFIMWWILWVRLILLSAGFIITLVWSKQLMMKVFTNFCLRDKRIHLVFLIFSSSSVESWAFIWNYKNMVEFSYC